MLTVTVWMMCLVWMVALECAERSFVALKLILGFDQVMSMGGLVWLVCGGYVQASVPCILRKGMKVVLNESTPSLQCHI